MAASRISETHTKIAVPFGGRAQGTNSGMRVLIVATTAKYPTQSAPLWLAEQVRSLSDAGVDVDLLTVHTHKTRLNYGRIVPRVMQRLRSGRYDLLHTHHTYTFLLADLARVLARCRIPIVLTDHEGEIMDTEGRARTWHPSSYLRHSAFMKQRAARRADFVIFVAAQLSSVLSPKHGHAIIPCGVDLKKFTPVSRTRCRETLGIPSDEFVVFFSASPKTGFKRFALAEASFQIIRRHIPGAVLLTGGSIAHDAMPLYFNAADVVLQTSFHEASPTVVKEALACEVPLVSTDVGDTRTVVDGVPYCFVCHDDPGELATRALTCRARRAAGGRKRLLELGLSLEQVASRLIDVYRQVARCAPEHRAAPGFEAPPQSQ